MGRAQARAPMRRSRPPMAMANPGLSNTALAPDAASGPGPTLPTRAGAADAPLRARTMALVLFALVTLYQIGTAGMPAIFDELSGQYAGATRGMLESGDWLVPTLNGVPRLQKPPLVYWLTAPSLAALGNNALAARLPTALADLGVVALTALLGKRLFAPHRGVAAGAILATSLGAVLLGKLVMPEPFFTLGLLATLLCAVRAVDTPARARGAALAAWACAALTCLTKGLHGLFFPGLIVAGVALLSPASRPGLRALWRPAGPLLFFALVAPWYLAIEARFPGYLADNLWNEQMGHVLDHHWPDDSVSTPLWRFWLQHGLWWFPWALFVPAAFAARPTQRRDGAHPLAILPAVWLVVVGGAVSLAAQRQDYYGFAAFPAFALLLSRAFEEMPRRRRVALAAPLGLLLLLGVGGATVWATDAIGGAKRSDPFAARNSAAGTFTGLAENEWDHLQPLLLPMSAALVAGAVLALTQLRRPGGNARVWPPVAAGAGVLGLCATYALDALSPSFSLAPIGDALRAQEPTAQTPIVYDGPSHEGSSLAFYADAPVRWIDVPETEFAVRARGIGRERFTDGDAVEAGWRAGDALWLVIEESRLPLWQARLGTPLEIAARSGTRLLLASPGLRLEVATAAPEP